MRTIENDMNSNSEFKNRNRTITIRIQINKGKKGQNWVKRESKWKGETHNSRLICNEEIKE